MRGTASAPAARPGRVWPTGRRRPKLWQDMRRTCTLIAFRGRPATSAGTDPQRRQAGGRRAHRRRAAAPKGHRDRTVSSKSDQKIRILIVDDHPVVRYGVRHILESESDISVVGEAESVDRIEEVLVELAPDVVLLDLELGDTSGVEVLDRVREAGLDTRVIVYTSHDEESYVIRAAELGVDGYLLKGSPGEEIIGAVRDVHAGGTAIESSVAAKLMRHLRRRSEKDREPAITFSRREKQVLQLLAAGKTNRDIGKALFISESTVKFHVHAILSKLEATNRTEAVLIAVQHGLITMAPGT